MPLPKSFQNLVNYLTILPGVGEKTAERFAYSLYENDFDEVDNLSKASLEELSEINDIGPIMAKSIVEFLESEQTKDLIQKLKNAGVNTKALNMKENEDERFYGMTFVLTGKLASYSRNEAGEVIKKYGGKVSSSVSSKTTYVLAGEDGGRKLDRALELGVKIIDEAEFLNMCK